MAIKKWTLLAYLAGENNLAEEGEKDINEMAKVGSNDDLNIIVQFDRAGDLGTRRFYIKESGGYGTDVIQEMGQTNCGDPRVLIDYLTWGVKNYPAEHYMVVLWNHGSGWKEDDIYDKARKLSPEDDNISPFEKRRISRAHGRRGIRKSLFETSINEIVKLPEGLRGIAYDDGSKDFLDNKELKNALGTALKNSKLKKFDIVGCDACLMNMLEVGYQIKDSAKIIVGSQETEPGEGWPYDKILATLAEEPDIMPAELANMAVEEYIKSYDVGENSSQVTQSALNLEGINVIKDSVNKLAGNLIEELKNKEILKAVSLSAFEAQHFYDAEYLDLFDFARLIGEYSSSDTIKTNTQELIEALDISQDGFVAASKCLGREMENAHGASIYFPGRFLYSPFYDKLDISKQGQWDSFIKAYQKEYNRVRR